MENNLQQRSTWLSDALSKQQSKKGQNIITKEDFYKELDLQIV